MVTRKNHKNQLKINFKIDKLVTIPYKDIAEKIRIWQR